MQPLHIDSNMTVGTNKLTAKINRMIEENKGKIMKSPCNHKFHSNCLLTWLTLKMECPTCRNTLPALE